MSENFKHIIALLFLLAFAGGFYYVSSNDTFFKGHQIRSDEISKETVRLKKEVITPLRRLDDVDIEVSFFQEPEYKALKDIRVTLREPSLYRENPFAPVN